MITVLFVTGLVRTALTQTPLYQEQSNYSPLTDIKQVTGMAMDVNNCIWLTTQAGLYRYDGTHFRQYNVLNTPLLKFERFTEIFTTTSDRGYNWAIMDYKNNAFRIDSGSRIVPFKPDPVRNERIVRASYNYTDLGSGKSLWQHKGLNGGINQAFLTKANQHVYLQMMDGTIRTLSLSEFHRGAKGDSCYKLDDNALHQAFATDKSFYLTSRQNIIRIQPNSKRSTPVSLTGDLIAFNKHIRYDSVLFYNSSDPGVWVLGYRGCIYEISVMENGEQLHTRLLVKDNLKKLPTGVFYSPSQRIILCYYSERGLIIYRPSRFSVLTWKGPDAVPRLDYYYSVLPDNDGVLTVNSSGIIRFSLDGQQKVLLKGSLSRFALFRDKSGSLWHDDYSSKKIAVFSPSNGKVVAVMNTDESNNLCGIHQSDENTFYVLASKEFSRLTRLPNGEYKQQILLSIRKASAFFQALFSPDEHTLWLGSDEGLWEFDIRSSKARTIPELKNTYVRSMVRLEKDNYLIGTYDKGIFQYFDKKWEQLPTAKGRLPSSAHGFVTDYITRSVWVSSNDGLSRIPLDMLLRNGSGENTRIGFINHFGPDISPEFNGSSNISATKLSDTCLVFANAKGLVVFNPSKLAPASLPVNVLVEPPASVSPESSKKNKSNDLVFSPVVPYYGDAGDLSISYRLTGNDDEWHPLSPGSVISYNNIDPGTHELQFRIGSYHSGDDSSKVLTALSFEVPTSWFRQTWVRVLAGILLLAVVLAIHNIRTWYLRKRKAELEKMVAIKTSELEEINQKLTEAVDELRLSEADLKQSNYLKDEYYAVLTHDLRSPLKFLSFNISQLLGMLPEAEAERLKKGLIVAYECTNDVYKLVDEFVYWIQNNENMLQPRAVPAYISALTEDVRKIYGFSLEGNKNTLVNQVSPDLRFTTDPQMFFIILRNAIDNANKYTTGGIVTVKAERDHGHIYVTISDNGSGIKEETIRHLEQLQYEQVQLTYKKRKSLGFYIMAMLTNKLNGRYTIKSELGKGTELSFVIPESKDHQ